MRRIWPHGRPRIAFFGDAAGPPVLYKHYLTDCYDGLTDQPYRRTSGWSQLPPTEKSRIVELALERPDLSSRELACHIVDNEGCRVAGAVCVGVHRRAALRLSGLEKSGISYNTGLSIDGGRRSLLQSRHRSESTVEN